VNPTLPQLYLVRHGETEWSRSGQHTGKTDIALTAHGEKQAAALAPWLQKIRFSAVLTSPRQRARNTCALAGLGENAAIEPNLAEWDYGDYEGLRSGEIRERQAGWTVFQDGCPNGESPADITSRADALIARLLTMTGNIALFSHGHFGAALAARWIGLPLIQAEHLLLSPATLSILGSNPSHPEVRVISLWNASPAG